MSQTTSRQSSADVFRAFWGVLQSANNIVPGVVVVGVLIAVPLVLVISMKAKPMAAATVFVVLLVAVIVYIRRGNFGEAAIALVAGLFPALSIDWTAGKFVAFCLAWVFLAAIALIIASVRLAAANQSVYTDAAIALGPNGIPERVRRLTQIADSFKTGLLGPLDRANVLRVFAYRRLDIETMEKALREVDILSTATRLDPLTTANFVADLYRIDKDLPANYLDSIEEAIARSASSPAEFVAAFTHTRHVALAGTVELTTFLRRLADGLDRGLPPERLARLVEGQG
jgi:hypothetical protein